jgi:hypothetical protein
VHRQSLTKDVVLDASGSVPLDRYPVNSEVVQSKRPDRRDTSARTASAKRWAVRRSRAPDRDNLIDRSRPPVVDRSLT